MIKNKSVFSKITSYNLPKIQIKTDTFAVCSFFGKTSIVDNNK